MRGFTVCLLHPYFLQNIFSWDHLLVLILQKFGINTNLNIYLQSKFYDVFFDVDTFTESLALNLYFAFALVLILVVNKMYSITRANLSKNYP